MTGLIDMSANDGSSKLKLVSAAILLIGGIGFVTVQYLDNSAAGLAPPAPRAHGEVHTATAPGAPSPAHRFGPPSPEDRAKFRAEMEKELNLTPEQKAQLDAIHKKYEGKESDFRARMSEVEKVLTPEQREKGRAAMMARMKAHMQERLKVLPQDEQAAFMKKLEERMKNGPPPGFGHGGHGAPPEGPPPP
ncbi:MAG TPA: Spy/CpxP family protein refolding chaperone [Candidatus Sumerlaeota bacterium]|nr:Spy/CpxP family protein refolding chaperone [Candidatus Sumerlaeota bacterium]